MAEPWFEPTSFGIWVGGVVLGAGGGCLAGLLGTLAGLLAPQGKARGLVLGAFIAFSALGVVLLILGLVALAVGQPYAIWFALLLPGLIYSIVGGALTPVIRRRYAEAEARRMAAENLRQS